MARLCVQALLAVCACCLADALTMGGAPDYQDVAKQMVFDTLGPRNRFEALSHRASRVGNSDECSRIKSMSDCDHSQMYLGLTCRGWGGSHCVSTSGTCSDISMMNICVHSRPRLGLECQWTGGFNGHCTPK
mmetsp:Transcript_35736/g.83087  ORF Transcript_35736/g.83087 Transcript_35736/m.83087 type:complete len:132 (-) Transcript_35736:62-457(-)